MTKGSTATKTCKLSLKANYVQKKDSFGRRNRCLAGYGKAIFFVLSSEYASDYFFTLFTVSGIYADVLLAVELSQGWRLSLG